MDKKTTNNGNSTIYISFTGLLTHANLHVNVLSKLVRIFLNNKGNFHLDQNQN